MVDAGPVIAGQTTGPCAGGDHERVPLETEPDAVASPCGRSTRSAWPCAARSLRLASASVHAGPGSTPSGRRQGIPSERGGFVRRSGSRRRFGIRPRCPPARSASAQREPASPAPRRSGRWRRTPPRQAASSAAGAATISIAAIGQLAATSKTRGSSEPPTRATAMPSGPTATRWARARRRRRNRSRGRGRSRS